MPPQTVARIIAQYGYTCTEVLPTQKGYRNESHPVVLADGRTINLILYKDEPGIVATIRRIHAVSEYLHEAGFPVRAPIDPSIMTIRYRGRARYAALYNYLRGETIAWEAYTQKHLKLLGKTMSDLHFTLSSFLGGDLPNVEDQYVAIYGRMQRYFADEHVAAALQEKLGIRVAPLTLRSAGALLHACKRLTHRQALHMDFVRSNILFDSATTALAISGILDFEKVAVGSPLFDVARTLAFLLVDCKYKTEADVRKYFLCSGYQKRGVAQLPNITLRLQDGNVQLLERLIDLFLLHDFYKFLCHNPYESLPQNEHFVRTRNLLLARGVITTTLKRSPVTA